MYEVYFSIKRLLIYIFFLIIILSLSIYLYFNFKILHTFTVSILGNTTLFIKSFSIRLEDTYLFLQDLQKLLVLKECLKDVCIQRDLLLVTKVQFQSLIVENQKLRFFLLTLPDSKVFQISARVVTRYNGTFTNQILILAGCESGIKKNQVVMTAKGLIGRVYDVGKISSTVMTIYDSRSEIPVRVERTSERGIVKSDGYSKLEVLYLDNVVKNKVKVGDRLVTSGDGGLFPNNLFVGKVVRVCTSGKVFLKSFVYWNGLEFIRITRKK